MRHANGPGAEPLLNAGVTDAIAVEVRRPEGGRPHRDGKAGHADLTGAAPSGTAAVREAGQDRTGIGVGVAVIEVVNGNAAVHEDGLLHEALAEDLREEVHVLLCPAGTERDVMDAVQPRVHSIWSPDEQGRRPLIISPDGHEGRGSPKICAIPARDPRG